MQIVAPDERRTALLRTLGAMLGPTRVAPGCLDARLYSDLDRRTTLLVVEEWESREKFERNLDMAKLNAIVAAIDLSSEAPVVTRLYSEPGCGGRERLLKLLICRVAGDHC